MSKGAYHPNAYLSNIRNIGRGLATRTRIMHVLERGSADARTVAMEAELHYAVVIHHLKLLAHEQIVIKKGSKLGLWMITRKGQKRLVETC